MPRLQAHVTPTDADVAYPWQVFARITSMNTNGCPRARVHSRSLVLPITLRVIREIMTPITDYAARGSITNTVVSVRRRQIDAACTSGVRPLLAT